MPGNEGKDGADPILLSLFANRMFLQLEMTCPGFRPETGFTDKLIVYFRM